MAQIEWIPVSSGQRPKDMKPVLVTIADSDGKRYVWEDVRFVSPKDIEDAGYSKHFAETHTDGIWEWAYEAGADYWEEISQHEKVIAWAPLPEPYRGE